MAGIDVVLWQLAPGFDEVPFKWVAGEADSEFFNYGLGKMASSLAHLDPKKKGRTMAEVFGAYGWAEGLKLMKWMTDHMLVRGVNYFVPHSFSPKEFPDQDCPPHMYARGKNPQFRYYRYLNQYTNRMSHLLTGGVHIASAAVLYHAEAEWSGEAMYFHKPVKALLRRQIDCDILPVEAIVESATLNGKQLLSGEESFNCLIIPYSHALPARLIYRIVDLASQGLPIYFINALPVRSSEGVDVTDSLRDLARLEDVHVVGLDQLSDHLYSAGFYDVKAEGDHPYLRYYHIRHVDSDVYYFFNEHPHDAVNTNIDLPLSGNICFYDAYNNQITDSIHTTDSNKLRFLLRLEPFETIVVVAGLMEGLLGTKGSSKQEYLETIIPDNWTVSIATSEQYPNFEPYKEMMQLSDLSLPGALPRFSGTFRYETTIAWNETTQGEVWLDLGKVYETTEVFMNDGTAGVKISTPYRFNISNLIERGNNSLIIEVTNTLVKDQRDLFSLLAQQEPSGLLGPVRILHSIIQG